ncbi:MAG: transcription elongation factor GreA [Proteobacteria bacterium]|nr:transcription elongation factor GreA [Pseudomonadota bacterium]
MAERFPITLNAFRKMEAELKDLKTVQRPAVIEAIAEARAHGDLSENAEYHAAREKQSFIEGRILELEDKVSRAEVIDVNKLSGSTVVFGAWVHLVDEDTEVAVKYQIVGEYEANLENRQVSIASPIARALIGKKQGDSVEVSTPGGLRYYEIVAVKFGDHHA